MSVLIGSIIKIALQVLAGVGIAKLGDTFIKPKVGPAYYPENISPGFKLPKILWFVLAFVIAFMAVKFLATKLKIKILK
jgi:hypothetical protein